MVIITQRHIDEWIAVSTTQTPTVEVGEVVARIHTPCIPPFLKHLFGSNDVASFKVVCAVSCYEWTSDVEENTDFRKVWRIFYDQRWLTKVRVFGVSAGKRMKNGDVSNKYVFTRHNDTSTRETTIPSESSTATIQINKKRHLCSDNHIFSCNHSINYPRQAHATALRAPGWFFAVEAMKYVNDVSLSLDMPVLVQDPRLG